MRKLLTLFCLAVSIGSSNLLLSVQRSAAPAQQGFWSRAKQASNNLWNSIKTYPYLQKAKSLGSASIDHPYIATGIASGVATVGAAATAYIYRDTLLTHPYIAMGIATGIASSAAAYRYRDTLSSMVNRTLPISKTLWNYIKAYPYLEIAKSLGTASWDFIKTYPYYLERARSLWASSKAHPYIATGVATVGAAATAYIYRDRLSSMVNGTLQIPGKLLDFIKTYPYLEKAKSLGTASMAHPYIATSTVLAMTIAGYILYKKLHNAGIVERCTRTGDMLRIFIRGGYRAEVNLKDQSTIYYGTAGDVIEQIPVAEAQAIAECIQESLPGSYSGVTKMFSGWLKKQLLFDGNASELFVRMTVEIITLLGINKFFPVGIQRSALLNIPLCLGASSLLAHAVLNAVVASGKAVGNTLFFLDQKVEVDKK